MNSLMPTPSVFIFAIILMLAACGGGDSTTQTDDDTTPPTVNSELPVDSALNVALGTTVSVVFSEAMSSSSITSTSFTLTGSGTVSGSVRLNSSGTIATFTPDSDLAESTSYTATITTLATDLAGIPLASAYTWTFTTGVAAPLPTAFYSNGANWNDYVKNNGTNLFDALDTACDAAMDGPGYPACIHGGEIRTVEVPGHSSCSGLSAKDKLDIFDWTCEASTDPVQMVSTGLKNDKNLSDLIDFGTPVWLNNSVTVLDGVTPIFTTVSAAWWGNPMVENNDGGGLTTAGTIYVVTADPTTTYTIDASRIALLIQPTVTLTGSGTVDESVISADTQHFLWLEGAVDATGNDRGVFWNSVNFSVIRNLEAANADNGSLLRGVHLAGSSNNLLSNVTAINNGNSTDGGHGVRLDGSSNYNTLSSVRAADNGDCGVYTRESANNSLSNISANNNHCGVYLYQSNNNTLSNIAASNNEFGVYLAASSSNNKLENITTSNNNYSGVQIDASSNNSLENITTANNGAIGTFNGGVVFSGQLGPAEGNNLANITAANNEYAGVYLYMASNNTLSNVIAANNGASNFGGLVFYYADYNTLSNVTVYNGYYGVSFWEADYNHFTGLFQVGGNNTGGDCSVYISMDPGLDSACANNGTSDAILTTGITLASSFIAKLTVDDSINTTLITNGDGTTDYTNITDWTSFENIFRVWGLNGSDFPFSDHQGHCKSGNCRIWDWSLLSADTVVRNAITSLPTGNDTITHTRYTTAVPLSQEDCNIAVPGSVFNIDHCENTTLRSAIEIPEDEIGNDNGLCESGETCLYTPNIGSYQGHGNLVSAGSFTDGVLTGITLMQYETNGYSTAAQISSQLSGFAGLKAATPSDAQQVQPEAAAATIIPPPLLELR